MRGWWEWVAETFDIRQKWSGVPCWYRSFQYSWLPIRRLGWTEGIDQNNVWRPNHLGFQVRMLWCLKTYSSAIALDCEVWIFCLKPDWSGMWSFIPLISHVIMLTLVLFSSAILLDRMDFEKPLATWRRHFVFVWWRMMTLPPWVANLLHQGQVIRRVLGKFRNEPRPKTFG